MRPGGEINPGTFPHVPPSPQSMSKVAAGVSIPFVAMRRRSLRKNVKTVARRESPVLPGFDHKPFKKKQGRSVVWRGSPLSLNYSIVRLAAVKFPPVGLPVFPRLTHAWVGGPVIALSDFDV